MFLSRELDSSVPLLTLRYMGVPLVLITFSTDGLILIEFWQGRGSINLPAVALQPGAGMGLRSAALVKFWKIVFESWAWNEQFVVVLHQSKNCRRVDS